MILRPYQSRAVVAIRAALVAHRAVCLALQVGGGKTVIACEIIRLVLARQRRAIFAVHRIELVEQARDRLAAFGVEAGIIKAGFPERRELPVQVVCIPSLVRREFPPADLIIFDEAHHVVSASWLAVLTHYRDAGAWILGITATPQRLDGKPLGEAFSAIVEPVTTAELIDGGYLIAPTVYAPPSIDRRGLRKVGGDYALPELAMRMARLTGSITEYWARHCRGRRTLCFAVNVAHSQRIAEALAQAGARVMHIDGTSHADVRAAANRDLRSGELDVVTQCQIWTEGLDIPELSALIIARPTASLGLHRQMIGRVMRPPGPVVVLDHAGNHHAHGGITDHIEWSLDGKAKRPGEAPLRTCPECFAAVPASATICPECGAELVRAADEADDPGVDNPGDLVPFRPASTDDKRLAYRTMIERASAARHSLGWARHAFMARFGAWPRFRADELELYACPSHLFVAQTLGYRTVDRCQRCYVERARARV